jgi:ubiquitin-like domain-containing CTD phosphatase 1
MIHKFNNSEYAKRDMSAFWMEILDYIGPVIDDNNQDHVRMALYSGHDSTIIPLMASLGAKMWNNTNFPYYASMMIIEVRFDWRRTLYRLSVRSVLCSTHTSLMRDDHRFIR